MPAEAKLICRDVWKLFGSGAHRFLQENHSNITLEALQSAQLIPAVRAVNLEIRNGEIFVIMGLSGSGKSTLVRCMSRLIEPTHGELLYEDRDLRTMSPRELIDLRRHKLGMVFQHFALLPHLSVLDNVAFPLEIQGQSKQKRLERARDVIELVGLSGREHYLPRQLSGGQQQRVGIARSLAVEPDLWFLDEPFSALDPLIRREMQDEFLRLQSKLRKSIVFITHDFDEAIRLADRIAIMKDGEVIQVASPEELVLSPATDYVREFTRYIPREKVITVQSIMTPLPESTDVQAVSGNSDSNIVCSDKIAAIAQFVYAVERPVIVTDEQGQPVGTVDRNAVTDFLIAGTQTG